MDLTYRKDNLINSPNSTLFASWLVLISLANGLLVLLLPLAAPSVQVIKTIDLLISVFLMIEALVRLWRAPNRRGYLWRGLGWMDLVGSLPIPFLRILRLIPMILVVRSLRRSDVVMATKIGIQQRAQNTLVIFLLSAIVIFECAGVLILSAEAGAPGAEIVNASDALWWAYVTVTTVGYGDLVPVTNQGRVVGVFLMTVGIGLFSVLTSFTADWFRRPRHRQRQARARLLATEPENVQDIIEHLSLLIDEQEERHKQDREELRSLLAQIKARA